MNKALLVEPITSKKSGFARNELRVIDKARPISDVQKNSERLLARWRDILRAIAGGGVVVCVMVGCGGGSSGGGVTSDATPAPVASGDAEDQSEEVVDEEQALYFARSPIVVEVPMGNGATVDDIGGIQIIDAVDINRDGGKDLIIHLTSGYSSEVEPTEPSKDSLVVFLVQPDGTYRFANSEIFGQSIVRFGSVSRKRVVADFNQDGYDDIAYALNREDGRYLQYLSEPSTNREFATKSSWASTQQVVMSNGDGTYRVDILEGDPIWQHGVTAASLNGEEWDLVFGGYELGEGFSNVYRYSKNTGWTSVTDYPYMTGWDLGVMRSRPDLGIDSTPFMFATSYQYTEEPKAGLELYKNADGRWVLIDEKRFGEFLRNQRFTNVEGDDQFERPVFLYKGKEVVSFVVTETCTLNLSQEEDIIIAMLDSQLVPSSQIDAIQAMDDFTSEQIYVPLAIRDDALVELSILDEQNSAELDVYYGCDDITADGLGDLSVYGATRPFGSKIFINNGKGDLVKTEIRGIEGIVSDKIGTLVMDVNGDSIGDFLQYDGGRLEIYTGLLPQVISE